MMNAVADALVDHAKAERKWVFIHTHFPLPEHVYIGGGIAKWDKYHGKTEHRSPPRRGPGPEPTPVQRRLLLPSSASGASASSPRAAPTSASC